MVVRGPSGEPGQIFVVSTGRCGSTLLSNMLRLHPGVLSLSEFIVVVMPDAFPLEPVSGGAFWEMLSRPRKAWTHMLRFDIGMDEILYRVGPPGRYTVETGVPPLLLIPLPHLTEDHEALFDELSEWVPESGCRPVQEHYRRLFSWLCRRLDKQVWVERSGGSLKWLPELVRCFPEARFVHLYRDGRECAVSMSRHNGFKLTYVSKQLLRRLGVDPFTSDDPPMRTPPAALQPFMPESFDRGRYVSLRLPVEDMGQEWSNMVLRGCQELRRLGPERVLHMGYEALVAASAAELRRLATFVGVEADEEWLSNAATLVRPQPPRWTRLPAVQRRRLVEACAPGMQLLYGSATAM